MHALLVIGATHFSELIVRLQVGLGAPMRLMGAAPPALGTHPEFAGVYEVARQLGIVAMLTREASEERRREDRDVAERAPVRPTDGVLLGGLGVGVGRGRLFLADLLQ